jgi:hypothetical protein
MVYRLKDGVNFDQIVVQAAAGSTAILPRCAAAQKLLERLLREGAECTEIPA